jgi:hypothetical protein
MPRNPAWRDADEIKQTPHHSPASYAGRIVTGVGQDCLRRQSRPKTDSGFREPIPQAEVGADFPAFIPALLDLGDTLIREAERVFVSSNEVDHRVGCFHQDVFPFWLFVRALT